jgi:rhamnose transport system permease protein
MSSTIDHREPGTTAARAGGGALGSVLRLRELPVLVALVLLVLITYLNNPLFLSPQGVKDLLLNATIIMILAAGQTLLIITRNIDLSVGSMLGLVAFGTGSIFAAMPDLPIFAVLVVGMAFGALLGSINGLLVTVA